MKTLPKAELLLLVRADCVGGVTATAGLLDRASCRRLLAMGLVALNRNVLHTTPAGHKRVWQALGYGVREVR